MATKVRGGPPTKEKRGTSPSQPAQQRGPTTQRGKSPITPKPSPSPSAAAAAKRSTSTSPSARNVPNYLKPTRSTGPESSSNPVKKNDTALKPVMSRRKSLDKPLPPSSPAVPKTRVSAIAKDMRSQIPSSPSSARSNTSSSSKATVGGRIGKARSFNAEKESRVLNHVKKVENEASGNKVLSTKETIDEVADSNNAIDDTPQIEAIAEKVEEFDRVSEDRNDDINDVNDDDDDNESEVIIEEDNKVAEAEPVIEVEEVKIDESSVTPKDETPNNNNNEGEQEAHTTCTEELSIPVEESEENEVEVEEEGKTEVEVEAKAEVEEAKEETKEAETVKEEEEEEEEEVKKVEEKKKKNEINGGGMKRVIQVVQGKKEMSVVSNDVIEETATKLREQRVNRVKALAGAFETVISNQ